MNHEKMVVTYPVRSVVLNEKSWAYFPAFNRNSRLQDIDEVLLEGGAIRSKILICKIVILTDSDYQFVSNTLDHDHSELWEKIGGSQCNPKYLEGTTPRTTEYYLAWAKECRYNVVQVVNETSGDNFVVNSEGFEYARYVGRRDVWLAKQIADQIIKKFS